MAQASMAAIELERNEIEFCFPGASSAVLWSPKVRALASP